MSQWKQWRFKEEGLVRRSETSQAGQELNVSMPWEVAAVPVGTSEIAGSSDGPMRGRGNREHRQLLFLRFNFF